MLYNSAELMTAFGKHKISESTIDVREWFAITMRGLLDLTTRAASSEGASDEGGKWDISSAQGY